MSKIGLSRLAVYTDAYKKNELLAALHFLLEENSLEEILLQVKQQYGSLESELQKKLPPIFEVVKSIEDVLYVDIWRQIPKEYESLAYDAMFESIARCTKRQMSHIIIANQRAELFDTYGRQFGSQTNFYVVEFAYSSQKLPFAVTATRI